MQDPRGMHWLGRLIYEELVIARAPISIDEKQLVEAYLDSPIPYHEQVQWDIDRWVPYTLVGFERFRQDGTALHVFRPPAGVATMTAPWVEVGGNYALRDSKDEGAGNSQTLA